MTDINADKVRLLTSEIDGLFARVVIPEPTAYVEVRLDPMLPKHNVDQINEVETKRIYFAIVSSYGIFQAGRLIPLQDKHFHTPEEAVTAWSHHMDQFLAENPERERIYWRVRPSLEAEKNFRRKEERWKVYSRLGVM